MADFVREFFANEVVGLFLGSKKPVVSKTFGNFEGFVLTLSF